MDKHEHATPRMHNRPEDPAYHMLHDGHKTKPKVHREGCYICEDMEFARMGLPLCTPCCQCIKERKVNGHIAADDSKCDDCGHEQCEDCGVIVPMFEEICTCDTPCCEADVGVGIITCGSAHCPTHGVKDENEQGTQGHDS